MPEASYAAAPRAFQVRALAACAAAPAPADCLRALPAGSQPVLLHDAVDGASLLAWNPDRVCAGRLRPRAEAGTRTALADDDPAAALERAWAGEDWRADADEPGPGWIGWFGWACAHAYERFPWLPPAHPALGDWAFARYRSAIRYAPDGGATLLVSGAAADDAAARARFAALLERAAALPPPRADFLPLRPRDDGARFRAGVEQLRAQIARGELYQANLSHALEVAFDGDPRTLYAERARRQPTRMSAYWEGADGAALLSHSPERFLAVRGALLETRPIKGTAPRGADPRADAAAARRLDRSAKERAELAMIVDMARNDLGRVALPGTVAVANAGEIEAFPTLFHRTATIRARWDPARGFARLWAAVFPPASVSGAPKVAALQAIAALEAEDRGPYCGALGWWRPGARPAGDFSVLIRTAVCASGRLSLRVGAGVVWDSAPEAEWQETLLKGRYLAGAAL